MVEHSGGGRDGQARDDRGPRRKISFGANTPWLAMSQPFLELLADDPSQPLAARVLGLALTRMDSRNHAAFGKGELADLLATVDRSTGEIIPARGDSISRVLKKLKRQGWIKDDSTARCILFSRQFVQKARGPVVHCQPHR